MLSQSLTPCMSVCACKMDTGRKTRAGDLSVLNGAIMITHQSSEDARSIVPPSWRGIRAQRGRLDLRSLTPSAPQTAAGCKVSIPGKPPARRAHYHQAQEGKKNTHTHTHTHTVSVRAVTPAAAAAAANRTVRGCLLVDWLDISQREVQDWRGEERREESPSSSEETPRNLMNDKQGEGGKCGK